MGGKEAGRIDAESDPATDGPAHFAEVVGIAKSLALLRRRGDFSPARALAMLERAFADPW